uniref:Peptidase M50 domain-containing protein n=2 Tax=Ditylum brightwellii TaxID=49249 RepID=A0A7S4SYJ7_9STRA
MLTTNYISSHAKVMHASSLADGIVKSFVAVKDLTMVTATTLYGLLGSILSGKGMPAGVSMSGPIGVIQSGADIVAASSSSSRGSTAAVVSAMAMFASTISINLAVVNSLPLPALDGGQLVFVLIEAVLRRKIDQRVQENINSVALLLLLFLSLSTALGDIGLFGRFL